MARDMKTDEFRLLNAREETARRSAQVTQGVIVGGSALALLFVGLALFAIRRDFAGRERAEAELDRFFRLSIDFLVHREQRRLLPAREPLHRHPAGLHHRRVPQPSVAVFRTPRRCRTDGG